ncbi:hypothetical protein NFI96_030717, partial [Prochilodus magdalenae]
MEQEELIERDLTLTVQLPEGQERALTVHGSKPVMDLLVTLCAQYHLNPSDHVIELMSTNQNQIKFKPNSQIGSLEAERVVLKPKGSDGNNRTASNMPVATVRLMINYRKSHKAVVRVNPRVPLAELMPAVCEKCEFDPDTTVLLRNSQSEDPLDLTKTLNDYGIRDLYAKDTKGKGVCLLFDQNTPNETKDQATPTHKACDEEKAEIREKRQREKENKGFLSLFRRSKKTAEEGVSNTNSAPTSPALNNQHVVNISCFGGNSPKSSPSNDMPKKRRAPQPPSMMGSQSFPYGLNSSQSVTLPTDPASGQQGVLSRVSSAESSLKRTKRKAPPPPCTSSSVPEPSDKATSQDSDPTRPPCSLLQRNCSQRDGLTTFTVVPRRRLPSLRRYEVLVTLEALGSQDKSNEEIGDVPKHVENLENLEIGNPELCEKEMILEKKDVKGENPGEGDEGELVIPMENVFDTFKVNKDVEKHLEEEREENEDKEDEDERDWEEKYKERRKRFQGDTADRKAVKLYRWMKEFEEGLLQNGREDTENGFPAPPLPVSSDRDENEGDNQEEREGEVGFGSGRQ